MGNPIRSMAGHLLEEGVIAAGALSTAFDDVTRHHRSRQRSQSSRCHSKFHAAGPTTRAASVTRPVMTTSAPAARASLIPSRPGRRWPSGG